MNKPGIEELLIACVLDQALLQRLQDSPDCVLAEYELNEEARDILTHPDQRLLKLLGRVVQHQSNEKQQPVRPAELDSADPRPNDLHDRAGTSTDVENPAAIPLPESRLALRLVPYLQQNIEEISETANQRSRMTVNYAAYLDQLPTGTDLANLPEVPSAASPGQPLPPLVLVVAVQPVVSSDAAGNQQITFSLTARLPQDVARPQPTDAAGEPARPHLTPWRHDVDSPAVKEAAARVRTAVAGDRYERLLELINIMVAPAPATETNS